jgi:protein-arginine kinase activator protein McsA
MLCEKCKKQEATVSYMISSKTPDEPTLQICESCLEDISPDAAAEIKKIKLEKKNSSGWTSYSPISS